MSLSKKNFQGFTVLGLDFSTNYGDEIAACCQFEFRGFEISISTGAVQISTDTYNFPQPILITNISTGEETTINGSVEDAIEHVLHFS